jgi:hypothetical protein
LNWGRAALARVLESLIAAAEKVCKDKKIPTKSPQASAQRTAGCGNSPRVISIFPPKIPTLIRPNPSATRQEWTRRAADFIGTMTTMLPTMMMSIMIIAIVAMI